MSKPWQEPVYEDCPTCGKLRLYVAYSDTKRLDWAMRHISGRAWREAGIEYGEVLDIRALIDAALAKAEA